MNTLRPKPPRHPCMGIGPLIMRHVYFDVGVTACEVLEHPAAFSQVRAAFVFPCDEAEAYWLVLRAAQLTERCDKECAERRPSQHCPQEYGSCGGILPQPFGLTLQMSYVDPSGTSPIRAC
jgi:hypothetical protein